MLDMKTADGEGANVIRSERRAKKEIRKKNTREKGWTNLNTVTANVLY